MASAILIIGESGSGKTTSMRNLNPDTTYYVDADEKGLSWKGWRTQYNVERKNYLKTADAKQIMDIICGINAKRPKISVIVVDTLNGIMISDEMARMKEKGYDKWIELAASVWDIIKNSNEVRSDLTVIFLAHSQTERDDAGYSFTRMKTSGRKLEKITLESLFNTVLLTKCVNGRYLFETYSNNSTAKTPMSCFSEDEREIEADITSVLKRLEAY